MIAALFVNKDGCYFNLKSVDPWDKGRDARNYDGPYPVVAHPPCTRWCRLAGLVESRYGYKKGEDDGCFESALNSVRKYGGVLEHPAFSDAFTTFCLPIPNTAGWQKGLCGGWSCYVEQGRYGHIAKKATWLYSYGCDVLPTLDWTRIPDNESTALVSWCGNKTKRFDKRKRISKSQANYTPIEFRDILISIARSIK